MAGDEIEESELIDLLEAFLQAGTEEANQMLEELGDILLSDMAFTLLRDQINELTDVLATLKRKLSLLEETRPQWERDRQQYVQQNGASTPAHEATTLEQNYIPPDDELVEQVQQPLSIEQMLEQVQQQFSAEQFISIIQHLQNMSDDEQLQFMQVIGKAEHFNDVQKMHFRQSLQLMKQLNADQVAQLAAMFKDTPPEMLTEAFRNATAEPDTAIPAWMPKMGEQSFQDALSGAPREDIEQAIEEYTRVLSTLNRDEAAGEWAKTLYFRASAYLLRTSGKREDNIHQAITDLNAALTVFTRETMPVQWASVVLARAGAYQDLATGNHRHNLELARADFEAIIPILEREQQQQMLSLAKAGRAGVRAALGLDGEEQQLEQAIHDFNEAFTNLPQDAPIQEATIAIGRANAYLASESGDKAHNREMAIVNFNTALKFFKRDTMPLQWAAALGGRGNAYLEREVGDRQENVQQALNDFNAALSVFSREQLLDGWIGCKVGRATACQVLSTLTGDGGQLLEQTVTDCDDILQVLTRESNEEGWAQVFLTRAMAYAQCNAGNVANNIEQALSDVTTALTVMTYERTPYEWAQLHAIRGNAYLRRPIGAREKNIEQAIINFDAALTVFKQSTYPSEWAQILSNRNLAYQEQGTGKRPVKQMLADYEAALFVLSPEKTPVEWASAHVNCGNVYLNVAALDRRENAVHAREHYTKALQVLTREKTPLLWARVQLNLGIVERHLMPQNLLVATWSGGGYGEAIGQGLDELLGEVGEKHHAVEESITRFTTALTVFTKENAPYEWAAAHRERASSYCMRTHGDRKQHLSHAIADYEDALTVITRESNPLEWAMLHFNRAQICLAHTLEDAQKDALYALRDLDAALTVWTTESAPAHYRRVQAARALMLERLQRWSDAHEAWLNARRVQRDLVAAAPDENSRSELITSMTYADMYLRDAQVLLRYEKPDLAEVAIALEEGRAQSLRVALDLDSIDPKKIADLAAQKRADVFLSARKLWRKRQHEMYSLPASSDPIEASELQRQRVENLRVAYGGFLQARAAIRQHDNPDFMTPVPTLEEIARCVSAPGDALVYLATGSYMAIGANTADLLHTPTDGMEGGMAIIVTRAASGEPHVQHIALPRLTSTAISLLINKNTQIASSLNSSLPIFLEQAVQKLGELGLNELVAALSQLAVRKVTLVAYGRLNLFPLPSVQVRRLDGSTCFMGDLFEEITFAPSARAAASAQQRMIERTRQPITKERTALLVTGDPQPRVADPLPFAVAEANTIRKIALAHGFPPAHVCHLQPEEATKERVVLALTKVRDAHLAVHGVYKIEHPRQSHLILAGDKHIAERERTISLDEVLQGEALQGNIDLSNLRLLVLSACKTSITDVRSVPNEVVGLSAGFLQAGAACVVASLWSVDDRATYLLMTRFAQLYLDPQGTWSPARALAEAQRWLREEATNRLLEDYNPLSSLTPIEETGARGLSSTTNDMPDEADLDALPYSHPRYWAAFVVTGSHSRSSHKVQGESASQHFTGAQEHAPASPPAEDAIGELATPPQVSRPESAIDTLPDPKSEEALDALLAARDWQKFVEMLQTQQEVLFTENVLASLRRRIVLAQPERIIGKVELMEIYLHVLENARSRGVTIACQHLVAELRTAAEAVQLIMMAPAAAEMRRQFEEHREVMLSRMTFALLYQAISTSGNNTEIVKLSEQRLQFLDKLRKEYTAQKEKEKQQAAHKTTLEAKVFPSNPKQAELFDSADADLVRCAQTLLPAGQELQALLPLLRECDRLTRVEEMPRLIALLTQAIGRIKRESAPLLWAILHNRRAATHRRNVMGDVLQNQELALRDYNTALTILRPDNLSRAWMQAMQGRATCYVDRGVGDQRSNVEQAISDLNTVLTRISRESDPIGWAQIHVSRGTAYRRRLTGDLAQNMQSALEEFELALTVITRSRLPMQWAVTTMMRGEAHANALIGDRAQHMEQALADYNDALTVLTRTQAPLQWAATLIQRANLYTNRSASDRAQNLEQAIADYNAAMSVFTQATMPQPWAEAMKGRGVAYASRIEGDQRENLEQALSDLNNALTIFTRESMPANWAIVMMERGIIYQQRIVGDPQANQEQALSDYNAALSILTRQQFPLQWASLLWQRGNIYQERNTEDRGRNIELALRDYDQAAAVLSEQASPILYAGLLTSRGEAYRKRTVGDYKENLQKAITDLTSALTVATRESMLTEWASAHMERGLAYMDERLQEREKNIEQALRDFNDALSYFDRKNTFGDWLKLVLVQAAAYMARSEGDRGQNIEKAIANLDTVLTAVSAEKHPDVWTKARSWRAAAYLGRVIGNRKHNIEQALADCNAALTVLSPETTYEQWSWVVTMRAQAYAMLGGDIPYGQAPDERQKVYITGAIQDFEAALTMLSPERDKTTWAFTQAALSRLHIVVFTNNQEQRLLRALAGHETALSVLSPEYTPYEWALIVSSRGNLYMTGYIFFEPRQEWAHRGLADLEAASSILTAAAIPVAYSGIQMQKAFVFQKMERWTEAHEALEKARAAQRDQVKVAMTDLTRSALIASFANGNIYLRDAICMLHFEQPDLEGAVVALEEGRAQSLRVALDLDSIVPEHGQDAAARERIEHFIAARNLWQEKQQQMTQPFPSETSKAGIALFKERYTHELDEAYAAFIQARDAIRKHDDPDFMTPLPTLESIARAVPELEEALVYLVADEEGMALIVMHDASGSPRVQHLSLPQLNHETLAQLFEQDQAKSSRINVTAMVETLGEAGINALVALLHAEHIHRLILVPYGRLGLFPLSAVKVELPDGEKRCLGDLFEVTFAPSARAAEIARQRAEKKENTRKTLLLAGNPQPSVAAPLTFAAAESNTIRRIVQKYAIPADEIEYLAPEEISKERLVKALTNAREAHLALHGIYRIDEPLRSHLLLAGTGPIEEERTISLQEVLEGKISITGLRLLTLSACETSVIDVQRVPNEVIGLAAGFLQAGAAGVIASLWPVDDRAAFLLMTRFALLYFDPQTSWSPAHALAEAQRWLREEATNSVLENYDPLQYVSSSSTTKETSLHPLSHTSRHLLPEKETSYADTAPDALPYADPSYWAAFIVTGC